MKRVFYLFKNIGLNLFFFTTFIDNFLDSKDLISVFLLTFKDLLPIGTSYIIRKFDNKYGRFMKINAVTQQTKIIPGYLCNTFLCCYCRRWQQICFNVGSKQWEVKGAQLNKYITLEIN